MPCISLFPSARPDGLGHALRTRVRPWHLPAAGVWPVAAVALARTNAIPAACALISALALSLWMRRRLGGLTGDVYGAAIELSETAFLCGAAGATY